MTHSSIQAQLEELRLEYDQLRITIAADEQKLHLDRKQAEDLHDRITELTRLTDESYPETIDD
ncbi:hypothetical protein [Spirochaeta africana]|uniref:Uncharacterized protein n=1 Tax=Spirochaeta africana (strain ATCC 700263 / DSM 8902 / Z-7692) TaxID=889378 RepID=H9UJG6_SPIAZ|nr:hypothetical protein [Spirochaeta africana]AFG37659.1 hypothetical protein Spiaf_1601 [Spirochaeta africana DSM 8902]